MEIVSKWHGTKSPLKAKVKRCDWFATSPDTYCPSNAIGGVTFHRWIEFILLMSTTWRRTSGLFVPGVGYRTERVSGNELSLPPLKPWTVITAPVANHGYVILPTFVSSKDAKRMRVPSLELHIASDVSNISSAMRVERDERKLNVIDLFSGRIELVVVRVDRISFPVASQQNESKLIWPERTKWLMLATRFINEMLTQC